MFSAPVLTISVKSDLDKFAKGLDELARRQVRFAAQNALNDCAKLAVADGKKRLPEIFDRPTPYTLNAFYPVLRHDKRDLTASVEVKDRSHVGGAAHPQETYLGPEILGGGRDVKGFEMKLGGAAPQKLIPAVGAKLDRFGNIAQGQIGDIVASLGLIDDAGIGKLKLKSRRTRSARLLGEAKANRPKYFVAKSKVDGRPLGIWQILGAGHVVPVLLDARRAPTYTKRFDFTGLMVASYRAHFPDRMRIRFAEAMATAIKGKGSAL